MLRVGFGRVCRLMKFTPSTTTRLPIGNDLEHPAALAPVLARHHEHRVVLANRSLEQRHGYSTSGASEMIFMNRRSRSSRATGPNTRVPIGSFWSLTSTAAFRSKRM